MNKVFLKRIGSNLTPISVADEDFVLALPSGKILVADLRRARNPRRHGMYWAALYKIRDATHLGDIYPTSDKLHKALLRATGFVSIETDLLTGEDFEVLDSTSYSKQSDKDNATYVDRAFLKLQEATGVSPETLVRESGYAAL